MTEQQIAQHIAIIRRMNPNLTAEQEAKIIARLNALQQV